MGYLLITYAGFAFRLRQEHRQSGKQPLSTRVADTNGFVTPQQAPNQGPTGLLLPSKKRYLLADSVVGFLFLFSRRLPTERNQTKEAKTAQSPSKSGRRRRVRSSAY